MRGFSGVGRRDGPKDAPEATPGRAPPEGPKGSAGRESPQEALSGPQRCPQDTQGAAFTQWKHLENSR
eukprot:1893386-Pyramimonas_sp.AAC.1